jgi:hypothetical protein
VDVLANEVDMLFHLPIVIAAMLSLIAVSDTVPQFDIARECGFEGEQVVEFGRCSENERAAFLQLQNTWAHFAHADKENCSVSTRIGGYESYVELLTCLEMARDVNDANNDSRDRKTTDATRPHALGATVTPEQVPGMGIR